MFKRRKTPRTETDHLFYRATTAFLEKYTKNKELRERNQIVADSLHQLTQLRSKYSSLVSKTAALVQVVVNETEVPPPPPPPTRHQTTGYEEYEEEMTEAEIRAIVKNATWDQLLEAVRSKTQLSHEAARVSNMIVLGSTLSDNDLVYLGDRAGTSSFGATYADPLPSFIDSPDVDDLLLRPYFSQYNLVRAQREEYGRKVNEKQKMLLLRTTGTNLKPASTVHTSQWFMDFMTVFARAGEPSTSDYPKYNPMLGIIYADREMKVLREGRTTHHNRQPLPEPQMIRLKHFAPDCGYHLANFASLFSTYQFNPIDTVSMPREIFTDVEIAIHLALGAYEEGKHYQDFLRDPSNYFDGHNLSYLTKALRSVCDEVVREFRRGSYFFVTSPSKGLQLMRRITKQVPLNQNTDYRTEVSESLAPVPPRAMAVLALAILRSAFKYNQQRALSAFRPSGGTGRTLQMDSPVGKLLNLDKASAVEFKKMYSTIEESMQSSFNAQLNGNTPNLRCVQKMYLALLGVGLCASSLKESHVDASAMNLLLARCVSVETNKKTTICYSGTTTAYPGLLFYTMLGLRGNNKDTEPPLILAASKRERHDDIAYPGMAMDAFFEGVHKRIIPFFDMFGAYGRKVTSFDMNGKLGDKLVLDSGQRNDGIRFMEETDRDHLLINYGSSTLLPAKVAYITILTEGTSPASGRLYADNDALQYFTKQTDTGGFVTLDGYRHSEKNQLFALPILFYGRTDVVDSSKEIVVKNDYSTLMATVSDLFALKNK